MAARTGREALTPTAAEPAAAPDAQRRPAAPLRVFRIESIGDQRWADFVERHPDAVIYHHPAWMQVLTRESRNQPLCLGCADASGQLRGVLPLLYTRGLPLARGSRLGRRLSSLPRTPVAGPLAADSTAVAALTTAAVALARSEPGIRLEVKLSSNELTGLAPELHRVSWRPTYRLRLREDPSEVSIGSSRNRARIRWSVEKAARLGVRIRTAETTGDVRRWYGLYLETMRWHCVPARPYSLFEAMWEVLAPRGLMTLLLAERREMEQVRLLAGSIYLTFGQTVFYAFSGSSRAAHTLRPNDAIHWHAIQDACRSGYRWYDFGEAARSNVGLVDFKRKWGASESELYRCYYPSPPERQLGTDESDSSSIPSQLARDVWHRVPLRITARVGKRLYGFL